MTFDPRTPPVPAACRSALEGRLRVHPEDFVVEEIPLYAPSGEGEHVLARLEKRNLTTSEAIRRVGQRLGVSDKDIGYAGLKDRRAVTSQWISITGPSPEDLLAIEDEGLRIVEAARHGNKLKLGHLVGNRFTITVRDVAPDALELAESVLATLASRGLPNGFGPQRFGNLANNHVLGGALVRGDVDGFFDEITRPHDGDWPRLANGRAALRDGRYADALDALPKGQLLERHLASCGRKDIDRESALRRLPKRIRSLLISAWQSAIFNDVLAERLDSYDTLLEGDVAMKHANGASFLVEDVAAELPRVRTFEVSPTGPLPGRKTLSAKGAALEIERRVLERWDAHPLPTDSLVPNAALRGERRALRIPVTSTQAARNDDGHLVLTFTLPRGTFATTLLGCLGLRDERSARER